MRSIRCSNALVDSGQRAETRCRQQVVFAFKQCGAKRPGREPSRRVQKSQLRRQPPRSRQTRRVSADRGWLCRNRWKANTPSAPGNYWDLGTRDPATDRTVREFPRHDELCPPSPINEGISTISCRAGDASLIHPLISEDHFLVSRACCASSFLRVIPLKLLYRKKSHNVSTWTRLSLMPPV